ncbi:MAG: xanthine dehydrogenase family protein subunit M [Alphaproteobacteria bacterium]|jgi:carbon-monoxide dehydrogenase medium subunit|nr:xanthine dehydrogenase family protein subunit M [Alphaproteobacteria bacterium]MDP6517521.1 xanthine dehydrogenase family protein subunit M [Alphaproteobacteria bacterium]
MKPPPFKYIAAGSIEDATSALADNGGDAKVLAGGQSLVPMLNFRLLAPAVLVDINRVPGLDVVEENADGLAVGALARHHQLQTSPPVGARYPVLAAAIGHVGHLAIRNRGTIGGSLAHADPAAELPLIARLLDAEIVVIGAAGPRIIAARDFFLGAHTTALEADEIITRIDLPALPPGTGWGFEEVTRRAGDFALVAVAATVSMADGQVTQARIALAGVGESPARASAAESVLSGQALEDDAIDAASQSARDAVRPSTDLHASADYRRHLVGVLTGRVLNAAWRRTVREAS